MFPELAVPQLSSIVSLDDTHLALFVFALAGFPKSKRKYIIGPISKYGRSSRMQLFLLVAIKSHQYHGQKCVIAQQSSADLFRASSVLG